MKQLVKGDRVIADFGDDFVWTSPIRGFAEELNRRTSLILSELSPADGNPRWVVFFRMVDAFGLSFIDDEKIPKDPPIGVVF